MATWARESFTWRKSSYSSDTSNCVEVGTRADRSIVAVRDSKDPDGGILRVPAAHWSGLLRAL